ncbi:MAG: metalloregulator ArsR/SmtB family transcription factor [Eubacteriales bacterium]|nr:metalloregulator ArsR/SmtB family transcription factor [Eubacteriales bacterium]MDD4583322.1 metalloregulator ArsR/SmtB family transcription factor [Eubacteriales bacterium]
MVSKSTQIKFPIHDHGQDTVRLLESMPSQETFDRVSDTFQLISNNTRLKILWLLCHSEECVTNIAAAIEMSAPAVSHHLRVLKQSGLIRSRRIGKETHYSLSDTQDAVLVHTIIDNFLGQ